MARIETSLVINRPIEEVFAYITDQANQPTRQSRLLEAEKTSEGPIGVGTTWRLVAKFLGQRIETTSSLSPLS
jgi:Polyketide cyclase / dehydrase and lipid transport